MNLLDVGIDPGDDPTMRWIAIHIGPHPFGNGLGQEIRCLPSTFFAEPEEIVGKDHAVAIDENQNEWIDLLC